ncbi:MAG: VCBS repeat-containing protein [Thalassolituus sp.]
MNYLTKLIFIPLAILSVASAKADIIIVNGDSYNEGLNDRTVVTSVGGNPGTTVGEQRLKVFEKAAEILNNSLKISAPVRVQVAFNSLYCISGSGTLGYAGPEGIEYSLADQSAIPHALYNQLIDEDIDPNTVDIYAEFNSRLDNNDNCLDNTNWHYGFDAPSGNDVSLLSIALHEIGHGLGFLSFLPGDGGMGAWWNDGFNNLTELFDPFSRQLINAETGEFLIDQNASDRRNTIRSEDNLVWNGDYVNSKANNYNEGINNGQVQIYAPSSYNDGSSISHFDIALSPNELMEPHYVEFEDHLGLALEALLDIGWSPNIDNLQNLTPVLETIGAQSLSEDSALSIELSATDFNEDTLTYTLSDADVNLGAELSGSILTVTPLADFNGSGSLKISVSDGEYTNSEIVTITVEAVNDAPIIELINNQIIPEDSTLNVTLLASDIDNNTLDFSIISAPSVFGASVDGSILTFTPQPNYYGSGSITVAVSDGVLTDETTFTLDILNVADAPILSGIGNQTLPEDTSITISLSASDVDSDSLVFALNNASAELNAQLMGNQLTITPNGNYSGVGEITVTVSDGTLTDSEIFSVVVMAENDAPILDPIADQVINEDASLSLILNASDIDSDNLSYSAVSSNPSISTSMNGNALSVNPEENYSGTADITVTVSDGLSDDSKTFSVEVTAVNDTPTFDLIADQVIDEDTSLTLTLNASDVDSGTLSYSVISSNQSIPAVINGNTLSITPEKNYSGTTSITVTVSDGTTTTSNTFFVSVNSVNDAPVLITKSAVTIEEDKLFLLQLEATDIDSEVLTYTAEADSSELLVTVIGSQVSIRASADHTGTHSLTVVVSDGELTDTATFDVIITPINDAPEIHSFDNQEFNVDEGLAIALSASDVDGDELTFSAESSDEAAIAAVVNGTTLTLSATDIYNGSATISITVSDGELTDTTTFIASITNGEVLSPLNLSVNGNPVDNNAIIVLNDLEDVRLVASGGNDTYDFSVNYNGSSRSDLLLGSGSERSLTVPASGAFAGSYFFTLNDTHSNTESFQFTVQRPVLLTTSVSPILANTRLAQLTIEGAPVGSDISLSESDIAFVDNNGNATTTVSSLEGTEEGSFTSALAFIDALDEGTFSINTSLLGASPNQLDVTVVSLRELVLNIVDNDSEVVEDSSVTINDERIAAWGINANYDGNSDSFINGNYELQLPSTALELRIDATGFNSQVIESDALETERSVVLELADGFYQLNGSVTASDFEFGSESPEITLNLSNGNTTTPDSSELDSSGVLTFRWLTELSAASPTSITFTHSAADDLTITLDSSLGSESIDAELIKTVVEEAPDNGDSGTDTGTDNGSGSSGGGNAAWLLITAIALLRRKRLKVKRA